MNSEIILDVREKDEFDAEHIPGSVHIPLSSFNLLAPKILQQMTQRDAIVICRSGMRAQLARAQIQQLGFGPHSKYRVYEGGILEWKKQGNPVTTVKERHFPVMRQVQIIAGAGVLLPILLSFWIDQKLAWIAAAFGCGLIVAGCTGFCGLAYVLTLMPWNRLKANRACSKS